MRKLYLGLPLKDQIMHLPESSLFGSGFRRLSRNQGVQVDFLEGEVSINETDASVEAFEKQCDRRCRLLTVRAFEISILDDGHGCSVRATDMIHIGDQIGNIFIRSCMHWHLPSR